MQLELQSRGFHEVKLWPRGVDADLFRPRAGGALAASGNARTTTVRGFTPDEFSKLASESL